ncbi:hypothetical protein B6N60_00415 [Richelia sinica FACHB-800]|uniref:Uncharacterized protein n=1 Tax=Richelia sinica FACHB-800 TaxID=1357546 RepID=A0A975T3Y7_9NOST|nr:hypothetical protein [Richelia sinica]MBD2662899.1 hypothetical protein [Richelia sinica FACHB-800]QXE21738.1 hypothetical protein B6N60_00415 [Richelia sinica FACHB-800]
MNINQRTFRQYVQILGTICGGLLMGLPAINQVMAQQTTPKVNPCPRIFYEEPHNNRVLVPRGCPPNALTQRLLEQGLLPSAANPSAQQTPFGVGGEAPSVVNPNPSIFNEAPYNRSPRGVQSEGSTLPEPTIRPTPPTTQPGTRFRTQTPPAPVPVMRIALANGTVNIRLENNTGANVTYQVIGDTAPRSLTGKSYVMLRGLKAPITLTFQREDGGFLQVTPQPGENVGNLNVTLQETTDFNQDRKSLRIQDTGGVLLN